MHKKNYIYNIQTPL